MIPSGSSGRESPARERVPEAALANEARRSGWTQRDKSQAPQRTS